MPCTFSASTWGLALSFRGHATFPVHVSVIVKNIKKKSAAQMVAAPRGKPSEPFARHDTIPRENLGTFQESIFGQPPGQPGARFCGSLRKTIRSIRPKCHNAS